MSAPNTAPRKGTKPQAIQAWMGDMVCYRCGHVWSVLRLTPPEDFTECPHCGENAGVPSDL